MKFHHLIPALVTALSFSVPIATQAKDHDDDKDHHKKGHDQHTVYHSNTVHYGSNTYSGSYSSHSHGSGYGYHSGYGSGSYYYGHGSNYYYRPGIGIHIYSHPSPVYREVVYDSRVGADVQRALRNRGYYRGYVDGDIGPGSRAAIRAYQYDRGLAPTGRIDSALVRSLGVG